MVMRRVRWTAAAAATCAAAAIVALGPAARAACLVPKSWDKPVDISNNAVAQAIYSVSVYVLPIVGAVVLIWGFFHLMVAVYQGLKGETVGTGHILRVGGVPSVFARVLEILVGMLLVAVPLSGAWVDVVNAGYSLVLRIVNDAVASLGGPGC